MRETPLSKDLRDADAIIEDDKLTMQTGGDGTLRIQTTRLQPLGEDEGVGTLSLVGDDFEVEATLRMQDVDALVDALHKIQSGEVFEDA
mgnify:CR=1 FL=1